MQCVIGMVTSYLAMAFGYVNIITNERNDGIMAIIKKVFVAVMVIGLTLTAVPVFAQSGKEALFGLKKLQARCQSGISYRDYSNAVADAKFPVSLFMESADAKKFLDLTNSMKAVMTHYEYAGNLWNQKMSARRDGSKHEFYLNGGFIATDSALGKEFKNLYPGATATNGYYEVSSSLSHIWGNAAQELKNTTILYAQVERTDANDLDKSKKESQQLKVSAEIEGLKAENEKLKVAAENERLKAENESLKKQLELMTSKRKK